MKIVILDGHAINPGDLSWDAMRNLGSLEVFDRTPEDAIVARAREAEAPLITRVPLSASLSRKQSERGSKGRTSR
jgi:glycerate dehydrogenase